MSLYIFQEYTVKVGFCLKICSLGNQPPLEWNAYWLGMVWYGLAYDGMVWSGMVWSLFGEIWFGLASFKWDMVWCSMIKCPFAV